MESPWARRHHVSTTSTSNRCWQIMAKRFLEDDNTWPSRDHHLVRGESYRIMTRQPGQIKLEHEPQEDQDHDAADVPPSKPIGQRSVHGEIGVNSAGRQCVIFKANADVEVFIRTKVKLSRGHWIVLNPHDSIQFSCDGEPTVCILETPTLDDGAHESLCLREFSNHTLNEELEGGSIASNSGSLKTAAFMGRISPGGASLQANEGTGQSSGLQRAEWCDLDQTGDEGAGSETAAAAEDFNDGQEQQQQPADEADVIDDNDGDGLTKVPFTRSHQMAEKGRGAKVGRMSPAVHQTAAHEPNDVREKARGRENENMDDIDGGDDNGDKSGGAVHIGGSAGDGDGGDEGDDTGGAGAGYDDAGGSDGGVGSGSHAPDTEQAGDDANGGSTDPVKWTCDFCTFINNSHGIICSMCNKTTDHGLPRRSSRAHAHAVTWAEEYGRYVCLQDVPKTSKSPAARGAKGSKEPTLRRQEARANSDKNDSVGENSETSTADDGGVVDDETIQVVDNDANNRDSMDTDDERMTAVAAGNQRPKRNGKNKRARPRSSIMTDTTRAQVATAAAATVAADPTPSTTLAASTEVAANESDGDTATTNTTAKRLRGSRLSSAAAGPSGNARWASNVGATTVDEQASTSDAGDSHPFRSLRNRSIGDGPKRRRGMESEGNGRGSSSAVDNAAVERSNRRGRRSLPRGENRARFSQQESSSVPLPASAADVADEATPTSSESADGSGVDGNEMGEDVGGTSDAQRGMGSGSRSSSPVPPSELLSASKNKAARQKSEDKSNRKGKAKSKSKSKSKVGKAGADEDGPEGDDEPSGGDNRGEAATNTRATMRAMMSAPSDAVQPLKTGKGKAKRRVTTKRTVSDAGEKEAGESADDNDGSANSTTKRLASQHNRPGSASGAMDGEAPLPNANREEDAGKLVDVEKGRAQRTGLRASRRPAHGRSKSVATGDVQGTKSSAIRKQPSRGESGRGASDNGGKNGHTGADTYFPDASIIQDLNFEESVRPWNLPRGEAGSVPSEGKGGADPCGEGGEGNSADRNGDDGGGSDSVSGSDYSGDM